MLLAKTYVRKRFPTYNIHVVKALAIAITALVVSPCIALPSEAWETFPYSKKLLTKAEVDKMDARIAGEVRGIIFGRHGRIFRERPIQQYLAKQSWYHGSASFSNSSLNEIEKKNLDLVRGVEAQHHDAIRPGDLRYWRDKEIPKEKLPEDATDLHIMRAEVEAIHGKVFSNEPQLQKYFEDRYWYHRNAAYNDSKLSRVERANAELLSKAESEQRKTSIQPGDMFLHGDKVLSANQLKGLSLYDLRVLRNEIYARHGHKFKTKWLQDYFEMEDWYVPKNGETKLTAADQKNLTLILAKEDQVHRSLSTEKLTEDALSNLYLEDLHKLRNEIYARHGRVFKDKWLQSYFSSLPWYKPNPKYKDSMLSAVERANAQMIAGFEKDAQSQFDTEEG